MLSFAKYLCFPTNMVRQPIPACPGAKTADAGRWQRRTECGRGNYGACKQIVPHSSKVTPLHRIRSPMSGLPPHTLPFLHSSMATHRSAAYGGKGKFKVFYILYLFNNVCSLKHFSIFAENLS